MPTVIHKMKRSISQSNNEETQDVVEFCEQHEIEYIPLVVEIVTGTDGNKSKKLHPDFLGYKPKQTDFKDNPDDVKKRVERYKEHPSEYTHIAIDTRVIHQVDIDCEEYSDEVKAILDTHPYTGSSTKEYGRHIFVRDTLFDAPNNRSQFKKDYGTAVELLTGIWAWCPLDMKVRNANKEFDFSRLNDMIEVTKTKPKKKPKARRAQTPTQTGDVKKRILEYVESLGHEQIKKCTFDGFKDYDSERYTWELKLVAPEGYCPAKNGECNNDHNPSVVITPQWCRIDCFHGSTDKTSDCHTKQLIWRLPEEKSQFFFKDYYEDYESKYGIKRDADIGTDDAFLTKLFMHRDGQKMVLFNGKTYIQNEFGLYKSPKDSVQKVIKEFFEDFLENSERLFKKLDKEIKEHTRQGNKATSHSQWDRYCAYKRVVYRLKSNKSRGEILKEIQCEVTNNEFDKLLDSDSFLLGFENGLLDLHTMEFRNGRSNEYVSMSCGYAFEWKTDEECKEWYDVFRTLYRSQEEMDWDWKEMSRSLVGINKEEIAKFELGDGNGKGMKATAEVP